MSSSGVHSNGFSLVRKVFSMTEENLNTYYDCLGKTLGEALIAPTKIYVKALRAVKEEYEIAIDYDKEFARVGFIDIQQIDSSLFKRVFNSLLNNVTYLGAVRWSTGSVANVRTRFREAHRFIDKLLMI